MTLSGIKTLIITSLLLTNIGWSYTAEEQDNITAFLDSQFKEQVPKPKRLWVKADLKKNVEAILDHPVSNLSYRYWRNENRTIWILDELGKERNITTAVVIESHLISQIKVLIYRESRGGEVQIPWFTNQFIGASNKPEDNWQKDIDSISGATLSVNAIKKQAELALFLQQQLP